MPNYTWEEAKADYIFVIAYCFSPKIVKKKSKKAISRFLTRKMKGLPQFSSLREIVVLAKAQHVCPDKKTSKEKKRKM